MRDCSFNLWQGIGKLLLAQETRLLDDKYNTHIAGKWKGTTNSQAAASITPIKVKLIFDKVRKIIFTKMAGLYKNVPQTLSIYRNEVMPILYFLDSLYSFITCLSSFFVREWVFVGVDCSSRQYERVWAGEEWIGVAAPAVEFVFSSPTLAQSILPGQWSSIILLSKIE